MKPSNPEKSHKILEIASIEKLSKILKKRFINIYRIINQIDPNQGDQFKRMNEYFFIQNHERKILESNSTPHHDHSQCLSQIYFKIYIPSNKMTTLQKLINNILIPYNFNYIVPKMLETLAQSYARIKNSGVKDKLSWDDQAEKYVLTEVLKEGCVVELTKVLREKIQEEQLCDSQQPLLLATPSTWYEKYPKLKLDFLDPQILAELHKKGYASKYKFIDAIEYDKKLYEELTYFDFEGWFEAVSLKEVAIRSDKIMWMNLGDIKKEKSNALWHISNIFYALPFELNLKSNSFSQISEIIQVSVFDQNEPGFHKLHWDSSFEKNNDNGRKFSVLYFCYKGKINGNSTVNFYEYQENTKDPLLSFKLSIKSNLFVILKSRLISYELNIESMDEKLFILHFWVNGPANHINRSM